MALNATQLSIASDAFQADAETDSVVSTSGLSLSDLQALYSYLQDDTATPGDYQSFLSESKAYASTDAWEKYDLDSRIKNAGFQATYPAGTLAMAHAAFERPGVFASAYGSLEDTYDNAKNALKSGYSAAKNALSNLNPKPLTDWFSTLFGWIKWIVIGAVVLLVLYVVYKVAALLK